MRERPHQRDLQQDVDGGRQERGLDRGCRIATGIERGGEAPHQHEGKEPDRIGGKGGARGGGGGGGEGAAGEERAHDEIGDDDGGDSARDGEEKRKLNAAGLRRGRALFIARGEPPRHLGQKNGADGDADHADGKLVDAVGVIERGQRAGRKKRGDQRIGEKRKLHAARADDRGTERLQEAPRRFIEARHAQPDADTVRLGVSPDQEHDGDAGEQNAPSRGVAGIGEQGREKQRGDDRQVEKNGRAGGGGEAVIGVEDAGEQRLDRHEREIGEGDAGERDGKVEARRIVHEARSEHAHDPWREQQRKSQEHEIDGDQSRRDLIGEELGGGKPRLFQGARIGRDEGCRKRPFGEDGAEMVGKAEGNEKGVGHRAGAEDCRHDHVADKTREARDEREPADGGNAPDHAWLRAVNCPSPFAAKAYPNFSPLTMRPGLLTPWGAGGMTPQKTGSIVDAGEVEAARRRDGAASARACGHRAPLSDRARSTFLRRRA